ADQRAAVFALELVKFAAVDNARDHFMHVIGRAHVFRDDGIEILGVEFGWAGIPHPTLSPREGENLPRSERGPRLRGGSHSCEMRDYIPEDRERMLVILREMIDHAGL